MTCFKKTGRPKSLNRRFNEILETKLGKKEFAWDKVVLENDAAVMGKYKGERGLAGLIKKIAFIPYSAEDFMGLLYSTVPKGKKGEEALKFYNDFLVQPFAKGINKYDIDRQNALQEWEKLKKEVKKIVPKALTEITDENIKTQDAIRLYIWKKQDMIDPSIIKMKPSTLNKYLKIVRDNKDLQNFADKLIELYPEGYPAPSKSWLAGDITSDIAGYINETKRGEYLEEWQENVDEIFSKENLNKLEAAYGKEYVDSLVEALDTMKTGRNKTFGSDPITKGFTRWANYSVGSIMFLNVRSAVLQTISIGNYLNWSDNNPIAAAAAFANQKQFWKDFAFLFNSQYLKSRRGGLKTDVNADDIARAAVEDKNPASAAIHTLLAKGFILTQIADSFAISSGGASFYRNRINSLMKKGMNEKEAEQQAFLDFQETTEDSQQSARPDKLSKQQRSPIGRYILQFVNTPMQYARINKKAVLDLINRRGDWKTNISKIVYYTTLQNLIFTGLQQGLFSMFFRDDEDDEELTDDDKRKFLGMINSMADTLLRGSGIYGAIAATAKNAIIKAATTKRKSDVAIELTAISPAINSKLKKIQRAGRYFDYRQYRSRMGDLSYKNPIIPATTSVVEGLFNVPVDRMYRKIDNIGAAFDRETEYWQKTALILGWNKWSLDIKDSDFKPAFTPGKVRGKTSGKTRGKTR